MGTVGWLAFLAEVCPLEGLVCAKFYVYLARGLLTPRVTSAPGRDCRGKETFEVREALSVGDIQDLHPQGLGSWALRESEGSNDQTG